APTSAPTTTPRLYPLALHDALPIFRHTLELWLQAADSFGDALDDADGLENLDIEGGEDEQRDAGTDGNQDDTPIVKFVNKVLIEDRKSTRLNSSHVKISYAVFCLKK